MLGKTLAAIVLAVRFVIAVVVSGLATIAVILKSGLPGRAPPPVALLRIGFAPMDERGAAILGCMVSLTPGTTTLDIDMDRHELLVHVLDASDPEAMVAAIRRDFEPGLVTLFGKDHR
jgi:multicomponent K+:H+ antiporter subunit E/multicomponent Na+:H+ antiporter subunit E